MAYMPIYLFILFGCALFPNFSQQRNEENILGSDALNNFPLIDGHNDLAWNLLNILGNNLSAFNFDSNLVQDARFQNCNSCHTDLPRLKKGRLGAQFWAAYVSCENTPPHDLVANTLEQIDVIKRLIKKYPKDLKYATTAEDIIATFGENKIASLIGVEGGHSINNKLSVLRLYYELGVRYMTLTHTCNLDWADAATIDSIPDVPKKNLTDFGKEVVLEMNRLGMLVDLSHVSYGVMLDALETSRAPVMFSHSSAKAVFSHVRNVPDDVLLKVKANQGIVMVNFYTKFIGLNSTIKTVIDHINHIVDIAGIDHVGIGSDFDGVESTPVGLEDASKYPNLFDELKEHNPSRWTLKNLEKLAGRNLIRVLHQVEKVKESLRNEEPR